MSYTEQICLQAKNSTLTATPGAAKSAPATIIDYNLSAINNPFTQRQASRLFFEVLKRILPRGIRLFGTDAVFFDDLTEGYCSFTHQGKKYSITLCVKEE